MTTDKEIKAQGCHAEKAGEICFDTETTGIDANDAELVGMSFRCQTREGWYVPCPADQEKRGPCWPSVFQACFRIRS